MKSPRLNRRNTPYWTNASILIVGDGDAEPNDTYGAPHAASAKAPINEGSWLGVVDRACVAIVGTTVRNARIDQVTLSQEVCCHESTVGVARLRRLFIPRYY